MNILGPSDLDLYILNDHISSFAADENLAAKREFDTDDQYEEMLDEATHAAARVLAGQPDPGWPRGHSRTDIATNRYAEEMGASGHLMAGHDTNPIEGGLEQAYQEIRSSLEMILNWNFQRDTEMVAISLTELDDALSNNWQALVAAFWRGVAQDVQVVEEAAR